MGCFLNGCPFKPANKNGLNSFCFPLKLANKESKPSASRAEEHLRARCEQLEGLLREHAIQLTTLPMQQDQATRGSARAERRRAVAKALDG